MDSIENLFEIQDFSKVFEGFLKNMLCIIE